MSRQYTPISVRFPPDVYDQVQTEAARHLRSLNMEIRTLVEEALKEREAKKLKAER